MNWQLATLTVLGILSCLFGIFFFIAHAKGPDPTDYAIGSRPHRLCFGAAVFFTGFANAHLCFLFDRGLTFNISPLQLLTCAFFLACLKKQLSPRSWRAFLDVFIVLGAFGIAVIGIPIAGGTVATQPPDLVKQGLTALYFAIVILSPVWTILLMRLLARRRQKLSPFRDDEQQ